MFQICERQCKISLHIYVLLLDLDNSLGDEENFEPDDLDQPVKWDEAIATVNNVIYWSRKALYDPKKRSFTLKYERQQTGDLDERFQRVPVLDEKRPWKSPSAAVPNLRLPKVNKHNYWLTA